MREASETHRFFFVVAAGTPIPRFLHAALTADASVESIFSRMCLAFSIASTMAQSFSQAVLPVSLSLPAARIVPLRRIAPVFRGV